MKKIPLFFCFAWMVVYASAQPAPARTAVKLSFEKTFLHTDRDVYLPGDTLWFKAYLINAQGNQTVTLSKTLYVELIDPNDHLLSSESIPMEAGTGHGDFNLPDSIPAGAYRLRAYTNWMRNFGNYFIFEKKITLIQSAKSATANAVKPGKLVVIPKDPSVRFFPEGGSMVENITSVVAVKAEEANGKSLPVTGDVISSAGDTITHFTCDSLGMGLMALLPASGRTYTALVKIGGRLMRYPLPVALKQGFAMQVKQADTLVHAIINYAGDDGQTSPAITIFVKHAGQTVLSKSLQMNSKQEELAIPFSLLPEGVCSMILSDQQGRPNCERLFYVHHPANDKALSLSAEKTVNQGGTTTALNIQSSPGARLSLAVIQRGLRTKSSSTIDAYFLLSSDLRGPVEQAGRYVNPANNNRFRDIDKLLLTQGWRDYIWRRLADSALRISYGIEQGVSVSGTLKNEARNKPILHANVTLFADQLNGNKLFVTQTDSAGRFLISDLPFFGNQTMNLAAVNLKGNKEGRFYMDTLRPGPAIRPINRVDATDSLLAPPRFLQQRSHSFSKVTQLKEVRVNGRRQSIILPNGSGYTTWGDHKIFNITPKDYEYKTVLWYLMQFTPAHSPPRLDQPGVAYLSDGHLVPPILTINDLNRTRVPYKEERDLIYNLPLDKIKTIEMTQVMDRGGKPRYIIAITTIENALQDNPGTITADVKGYYLAQTFYQPLNDDDAIEYNYRSTLLWRPDLQVDDNGHAVVKVHSKSGTSYEVVVQGLTKDGLPVSRVLSVATR